jgi:hypothetical protein
VSLDVSPVPPDTPPSPLFFAEPRNDDDDDSNESKEKRETEKSAALSTTTTTATSSSDTPSSLYTVKELEQIQRLSKEWGNKAVDNVIVRSIFTRLVDCDV